MNQGSQRQLFANGDNATVECSKVFPHPSSSAIKSFRTNRGPEAGVRGIPSPFINLDERGRDTPYPSLLPLLVRKGLIARVLGCGNTLEHSTVEVSPFANSRRSERDS